MFSNLLSVSRNGFASNSRGPQPTAHPEPTGHRHRSAPRHTHKPPLTGLPVQSSPPGDPPVGNCWMSGVRLGHSGHAFLRQLLIGPCPEEPRGHKQLGKKANLGFTVEPTLVPLLTIPGFGPRISGNWRPSFSSTSQGTRDESRWRWQCWGRPAVTQKGLWGPRESQACGSTPQLRDGRSPGCWAAVWPAVEVGGGGEDVRLIFPDAPWCHTSSSSSSRPK